jgi:hypothetical protein
LGQCRRGTVKKHLRVVMRDFAGNVVSYMSFRDSMCRSRANPTHKRAKVTEQFTIKRCQSPTRECEFFGPIVRQ